MKITGKLLQLLSVQSGTSINGHWSKQIIIVETTDEYPKKVCISIWNGRVDISKLEVGKEYSFHCNIESKEYKGKWYTEVTLWKIDGKIKISVNDFLKTTQSYQNQQLELNEDGVPDFDPRAESDKQEPDWDNIIIKGSASNTPKRFKITGDDIRIPTEKITSDDTTDPNSAEDSPGEIKRHGKLIIDPEKLKNLHSTRKIKKDESNDPDSSL